MVALATHNPFASRAQSLPAPACAPGCRVVRAACQSTASAPSASTAPACLAPAALAPRTPPALPVCRLHHPLACDSDSSAPRPDAGAASSTTAPAPLRCAPPPRPAARTDGGFPHSLLDYRLRRALNAAKLLARSDLGSPGFGATFAPCSARITAKNACAHIASVICRYHPVHERTS
jgi:hypothetical protein